ncbi:MAG TPA: nucleotide exchange factor GrpE [Pseudogracilibacillus sp.]|nr:nucleotide exchange factor GrpE [Pseudogracilibacillus sp.]
MSEKEMKENHEEVIEETVDEIIDNDEKEEEVTGEETDKGSETVTEEAYNALKTEKDKLYEQLLRIQAEYENYKRRTDKERIAERKYKAESLATELLPVLDNFERALQTEVTEENQSFKDGVAMVYNQLTQALEAEGVTQIEALHQPFDPNLHHAVMQDSDDQYDENIVLDELQKGYQLKDKVIRPTMVKVNQ